MKYYVLEDDNDRDNLIKLIGDVVIECVHFNTTVRDWLNSITNPKFYAKQKIIQVPTNVKDFRCSNTSWMSLDRCKELDDYKHWLDNAIKP